MHHSEVEQRLAIEKHCYFLKCFVRYIIKNNTVLVPQVWYGTLGPYLLVPLLPAAAACGMLVTVPYLYYQCETHQRGTGTGYP
jgi:hypothetical protein